MKRRCVLFLHGFMGSPGQFDRLIALTRGLGVDAYAPTLPGHGEDAAAFCRARPFDWQQCARSALDELRGQYDDILIVTHSMGGLLALREAADNPQGIAGVLALALPLRIRVTPACLRLWLSVGLFPGRIRNPRLAAARDACSVRGVTARYAFRLLPNALGLLRLAANARRDLRISRVPLTVLQSPRDEIVSPASGALAVNAGAAVRTLGRSGHFWYPEDDARVIGDTLQSMLANAPRRAEQ